MMIPRRRLVAKKNNTPAFLYDEFFEVYRHETCPIPPHLDDPSEKVDWA